LNIEATDILLHTLNNILDFENSKIRRSGIVEEQLGTWAFWEFQLQYLGTNASWADASAVIPVCK
jgi:hypothetical protein